MELGNLFRMLGEELNEALAPQVHMARRRAMKSQLETDKPGTESESNGQWQYTSSQGIKVTELKDDTWEVEFEGKKEKGDFETILKKAKAASKLHYSRRESKLS
jgi:hypothetical protein